MIVLSGAALVLPDRMLTPGTLVIDANEEMWRFFSRHKIQK